MQQPQLHPRRPQDHPGPQPNHADRTGDSGIGDEEVAADAQRADQHHFRSREQSEQWGSGERESKKEKEE